MANRAADLCHITWFRERLTATAVARVSSPPALLAVRGPKWVSHGYENAFSNMHRLVDRVYRHMAVQQLEKALAQHFAHGHLVSVVHGGSLQRR